MLAAQIKLGHRSSLSREGAQYACSPQNDTSVKSFKFIMEGEGLLLKCCCVELVFASQTLYPFTTLGSKGVLSYTHYSIRISISNPLPTRLCIIVKSWICEFLVTTLAEKQALFLSSLLTTLIGKSRWNG